VHGHLGGRPPAVDLAAERRLSALLVALSRQRVLSSAHDLSDGGLAQALAESCLRHGIGASVWVPRDAFVGLFSETAGRVLETVADGTAQVLEQMAGQSAVPLRELGRTGGDALTVESPAGSRLFSVGLDELRAAWSSTLPAAFA
jgi:phosphoribosylformylglycinamidine synthase